VAQADSSCAQLHLELPAKLVHRRLLYMLSSQPTPTTNDVQLANRIAFHPRPLYFSRPLSLPTVCSFGVLAFLGYVGMAVFAPPSSYC
jgi:hypothetical protein